MWLYIIIFLDVCVKVLRLTILLLHVHNYIILCDHFIICGSNYGNVHCNCRTENYVQARVKTISEQNKGVRWSER